jgi:hypothetical protein
MSTIIGYCHNCACTVTTENACIGIIGSKDIWCNKPECRSDVKRWLKLFIEQHPITKLNKEKQKQ